MSEQSDRPREPEGKKLLGEILVEEGYLSAQDLTRLVQAQRAMAKSDRKPIGRLAVEMGFLTDAQLRHVLDRHGKRLTLGELLVARGLVHRESLAAALALQEEQGGMLGEILMELGILEEVALAEALADQADLAYVPLGQDDPLEPELARWVNPNYAVRHGLVPIGRLGRRLTIAIWHPCSLDRAEELVVATGLKVQVVLSTRSQVSQALQRLYSVPVEKTTQLPVGFSTHTNPTANVEDGPLSFLGLDAAETKALAELIVSGDGMLLVGGPGGGRVEETYLRVLEYSQAQSEGSERAVEASGELTDWKSAERLFRARAGRILRVAHAGADHCVGAVARVLELGVPSERVAAGIVGSLVSYPVRRNCPTCTQAYEPHLLVLSEWLGHGQAPPDAEWARGRGCPECRQSGFAGEIAASELWIPNDIERGLLAEGAPPRRIRETMLLRTEGLGRRAFRLAMRGETTLEELLRKIPAELVRSTRFSLQPSLRKAS